MRQRPDADPIDAGPRQGRDGGERDSAGRLEEDSWGARISSAYRFGQLQVAEVVHQDDVGIALEGLIKLLERVDFHLDDGP